ncbi:MAG: hypothetical protein Q9190_004024 [Brigantiaea leucoxantha]
MLLTSRERRLCQILRDLPAKYGYRYTDEAKRALQQGLFRALAAENDSYLNVLFARQVPRASQEWCLQEAQGMSEGAEYMEGARGKACGHIFKNGEAIYRCKNCEMDDTCVLCSRCFNSSDHTGHIVSVNISPGNSGCCDCGDTEAWKIPVNCGIHSLDVSGTAREDNEGQSLPDDFVESVKMTIGRTFDYLCDVISCSPEKLRLQKSEDTVRQDEQLSHLASKWYEEAEDPDPEFALVLWNDEKHTIDEVKNQVARACKETKSFGLNKANETNDVGRSVLTHSKNVPRLLKVAKIIEEIKITVSIRSSRDTFREQMCGTMIEWLQDIAGCTVGQNYDILRFTVCEEMLKSWRTGSAAANSTVGKDGLDDNEIDESAQISSAVRAQAMRRGALNRHLRRIGNDSDSDADSHDNAVADGDDEANSEINDDEMEVDLELAAASRAANDQDLDMRATGEPEDDTEVSEATYAGYPPPPPPPPPRLSRSRLDEIQLSFSNHSNSAVVTASSSSKANIEIPRTPSRSLKKLHTRPPDYWLEQPKGYASRERVALHEDLRQRIRLDWMILFDLRLWKKARTDLRELYIGTVVSVPRFKRILGLRFAGLYTVLSQLYLIADREPDHSIIHISTQMLTTPSITEEIVERGNFLTILIAILYTFLTTRQVSHPWEVSINDTLDFETGPVTNRRMAQTFQHLKHVFDCEYVHRKMRKEQRYVLQFLDLIRLPQGICPNTRAVGDHVEYETDTWIGASLLIRDVNRLCRVFSESFVCHTPEDVADLSRVIRMAAKATVINATGAERVRFDQAEIKSEVRFRTLQPFEFDSERDGHKPQYSVVDFVVEKESISFYHPLHYTLSWLMFHGKALSASEMGRLLRFTLEDLKEPQSYRLLLPDLDSESYLMALFDLPLRICAWLAQMKAGMWVRNGLSLRHQMGTYRGVAHRDLAHNRDIFLLQTAMVVCAPSRVLASMVDRFGVEEWMRGNYAIRQGFEASQQLDVAEDFIHLMIVLLSDRTALQLHEDNSGNPQAATIRRDITHILCFKPLSFSDLSGRLSDKVQDSEEFQNILHEMTTFRAPEGLADTGTFELKPEYLADIDPYIAHFSKNQRDEAENAYRTWMAKKTGRPAADIVLEPKLQPLRTGLFQDLSAFTRTDVFCQIIYHSLLFPLTAHEPLEIPDTRIEAFLQVVLHLMLAAVVEDDGSGSNEVETQPGSFVAQTLCKTAHGGPFLPTIFSLLVRMLEQDKFKACHPKIRLITHRSQQRCPRLYASAVSQLLSSSSATQRMLLDRLRSESPMMPLADDQETKRKQAQELREAKKRQALDRQAKIMASFQQQQLNFEKANPDSVDWGEIDVDDLGDTATGVAEEHKKLWKYPAGNCIVCQEEVNDSRLYGTFALLSNSNIFRRTDLRDPDFVEEALATPTSLDRSAESIRPFGVAGKNRVQVRKITSDGQEFFSEHQGLGKGFPPSQSTKGYVSTGCGHIMHYKCFEGFCVSAQRRQQNQIARNHPERLVQKEFVCPLCKALGNTFLPIIWRGKEELYPGVLQVEVPFHEWLRSGIGLAVTRFQKHAVGEDGTRFRDLFMSYTSENVIAPLAARLMQTHTPRHVNPGSLLGSNLMPGQYPVDENTNVSSPSSTTASDSLLMQELMAVYQRLRDTVKFNELTARVYPTKPASAPDDLIYTDTLAKTLGFSITATEIAQRGIKSEPGTTLLDKIPALSLTHLRILSETASSYIAVGGMRNSGINRAAPEFSETNVNQLLQLFAGHPQIAGIGLEAWRMHSKLMLPSALSLDPFAFLAECSICLVPAFNLEIHHVARVCYLLELVKVAICLLTHGRTTLGAIPNSDVEDANMDVETSLALKSFILQIQRRWDPKSQPVTALEMYGNRIIWRFYRLIRSYALPFLRKVVILLHVRCGVDFPDTGFADIDEPELDRLTKALRMPSLKDMFLSAADPNSITSPMVTGWVEHYRWSQGQEALRQGAADGLRLNHPAIFELIGLPKTYDTLTAETIRRRCPTTGKDLSDPALCLFCGAIFCSQATCCLKEGKGGCNQHMKRLVQS